MDRSKRLKSYHRDLSRRSTVRLNEKMRDHFGIKLTRRMKPRAKHAVAHGWAPFVGWWERGVGFRLRGIDAVLIGREVHDDELRLMATEAIVEEIMTNPRPFVITLLEDQVLADVPFYEMQEKPLLRRMRDRYDRWRS